ncbi:LysR family transcriptional regulator [Halomonas halocynthiae]|uniref:LysR family transcriptional regulator n=1 Tax=Halomonas halocynthiae TaxID=176290 RepID=UPI0009FC6E6C
MGRTQAVSRVIRQLEALTGVTLLKRNDRNVALTAEGKALYRKEKRSIESAGK